MENFDRILELQLYFIQKDYRKRRAPYHLTITADVQRIADTGSVMPNHAHAGTSTAVAHCVANSFNETSQCPQKLWTSEKNLFETVERQDLKYWQIHFVAVVTFHPVICISSSSVFCPRAGLSLQTQAPRLQFCPKAGLPLQTQEPRLQFY